MKNIVPIRRVTDFNMKPRVGSDGTGADFANLKMSMNPFNETSGEEAISLKDKDVV